MTGGTFKCYYNDAMLHEISIEDEPVEGWNELVVTWNGGCQALMYLSPAGGYTNVAEIKAEGTCPAAGAFFLFF